MNAIIQGPIYPNVTEQIIYNLLQTSFIKQVIVSCWESCPEIKISNDRIKIVRSIPITHAGYQNRNLQIQSTKTGLQYVTSEYCAKFRSDQIISVDSLNMMNDFFHKFKESKLKYENDYKPKCKIFVCGDFWPLPFHPRDHVYWSDTESIKSLFSLPYDSSPKFDGERFNDATRAETYIGSYYYAKFNHKIYDMIKNQHIYLYDNSPKRQEALDLSLSMKDEVFQVFPRINLTWPKYNIYSYEYAKQSVWERWYDEKWN
jgi:hypothetical protein